MEPLLNVSFISRDEAARRANFSFVPAEKPMSQDPAHILVVDDEPDILEFIGYNLEKEGYSVASAENGADALVKAGERIPDLVLLDIMMPEMDGIELIHALRRDYPHLPIIAASGMADSKSQAALEAGAQSFLSKPFTADVLYAALDDVLADESV